MEASSESSYAAARRLLRRRWLVVVVITAAAVAASVASVVGRSSSYQVSGQLLIVPLSQDDQTYFGVGMLRDAGDPSLTAGNAAQVLHTQDIARATAAALGHGTTPASVLTQVQVRPAAETNVLEVVATAASPRAAGQLGTAYLTAVEQVRQRLVADDIARRIAVLRSRGVPPSDTRITALQEVVAGGSDPTVQLAQPASPATPVTQTPAAVLVLLGLLGGLFLGVLSAVASDRLGGRVRDEDEARRVSGLPVWGRVPAVPVEASVVDELAMRLGQATAARSTVAIVSPGEGDGRTSTAVALAQGLARRARSVALVLLEPSLDDGARRELEAARVRVVDAGAAPLATTLGQAGALADLVLVDGPDLARGADLLDLLTPATFVLVARVGHTMRADLVSSLQSLEEAGVRPAGLVLLGGRGARTRRQTGRATSAASVPVAGGADRGEPLQPPVRA